MNLAAGFQGLLGGHPDMLALYRTIEKVSRLSASVLIVGESGTGKELVARALHRLGRAPAEPFVGINCGAFTRSLLEDQLFGHVRGAFTGAVQDQPGVFVAAGGGTLFLDEVTEMALELQGRLLRALQEREVVPLGTNRATPWRARLVAATNRDVQALLERGELRRDLYHRISVVQIRVPPLRERREDIPLLAESFLSELAGPGARPKTLTPEALDLLLRCPYPGNVRELRNALERAHALGAGEAVLAGDLPPEFREGTGVSFKSLAQVEREHIESALCLARGKKNRAAELLRIDRNRLNRMLKRHGIILPGERRQPELNPLTNRS